MSAANGGGWLPVLHAERGRNFTRDASITSSQSNTRDDRPILPLLPRLA